MSTYVLIHGGCQGGWCWDKVAFLLEKEGHNVIAPDLPGHGNDKTPIPEISLQAYVKKVCNVLDAQSESVILVGNSMGGAVITQAAEYRPNKIKLLVYLSAMLLQNGENILKYLEKDKDALMHPNVIWAEDQTYFTIKKDSLKNVLYEGCPEEDVKRAKSLLVAQAVAPFATPVNTTASNFGHVPRIYITCNRDKAISPQIQKAMYDNLPCEKVIKMDTGHAPFFSAPEELVGHLRLL